MRSSPRVGTAHIQVQSHTPLFEQLSLHDEIKSKRRKINEVKINGGGGGGGGGSPVGCCAHGGC